MYISVRPQGAHMICNKCQQDLSATRFYIAPSGGYRKTCRSCQNKIRSNQRRADGVKTREQNRVYMKQYRIENRDKLLAEKKEDRINNPMSQLWRHLTIRKKHLNIDREAFLFNYKVPDICPVLGIPISYMRTRDNFPSIDRIDPNRPYQLGNIAIISYRANMIKSVGSAMEHIQISNWMQKNGDPAGKPLNHFTNVGPKTLRFGRAKERV
jgi:hypothetical protein